MKELLAELERWGSDVIFGRAKGFRAAIMRLFMLTLSGGYRGIVQTRLWLFRNAWVRQHHLGTQVVAIGNITVGGTGKTPVVELLARSLRDRGRRVAILSRGYKSRKLERPQHWQDSHGHWIPPEDLPKIVSTGSKLLLSSKFAGDEPYMLARNLSGVAVIVDKDRVKGGRFAVSQLGANTLLLDDGMQYLRLAHAMDIVLVDAREPFGTEALLPRGTLREPPANLRRAYDVRKVISVLADEGSVLEIKPTHARNIATVFGRLEGRPVGFIANNPMWSAGMLDGSACDKAAHFIALCDAFGLPLIYLIDVPGFAIGSGAELNRMPRRSAKLIHELGNATVPRFSVVLRKGYGLAYVAMAGGRGFGADGCFAWPTAQICAMSVEGAVDVGFRREIRCAPDPAAKRLELIETFKAQLGAIRAAEHFGIDDVIDPRDTRRLLVEHLRRAPPRRRPNLPPKFRSIAPI